MKNIDLKIINQTKPYLNRNYEDIQDRIQSMTNLNFPCILTNDPSNF